MSAGVWCLVQETPERDSVCPFSMGHKEYYCHVCDVRHCNRYSYNIDICGIFPRGLVTYSNVGFPALLLSVLWGISWYSAGFVLITQK